MKNAEAAAAKPDETAEPEADEKKIDTKADTKGDEKKAHPFTWERSIEVVKLLATVWVAMIGTICTMQYNDRQHELNRIEAIAKVLPHLASDTQPDGTDGNEMARDGAIWAAFRIANNKVMLRDLAALYPADIYRVVSSIAAADGLQHDDDALTALEVASEKLASKYANDEKKQQLSVRLLEQSMHIRQHLDGARVPLNIVDLSTANDFPDTPEQTGEVMHALNRLGKMHLSNSSKGETIGTERSRARQLFVRARQIGITAKNRTPNVLLELVEADSNLATLLRAENKPKDAEAYEKESKALASDKAVDALTNLEVQESQQRLDDMDKNGDGHVSLGEMQLGVKEGIISKQEFQNWQQKNSGAAASISIDKPSVVPAK